VATAVAVSRARVSFEQERTRPLAVGDCVVVASSAADAVRARRSSRGDDLSYTVCALA